MAQKPETRLRGKIVKAIEREYPEDYVAHPHGSMYGAGMLDLHVTHESLSVWLEIKMPKREGKVSKTQQSHINRIRKAGGVAEVVTSPQEALDVLSEL